VVWCYPVQPNGRVSDANLAVNGLTLGIAVDDSWFETEGFDEKVMRRWDVLVDEKWDDALEFAH
jgi:hypothetical protein